MKRISLCSAVMVLAFPILGLAQSGKGSLFPQTKTTSQPVTASHTEDDNPLNPEYSGPHPLAEYLQERYSQQTIFDIEGFQAELGAAMMQGWGWGELYAAVQYSMFSQHEGTAGFYGCWLGGAAASATMSFLVGPAGPATFFGGSTSSALICFIRHIDVQNWWN